MTDQTTDEPGAGGSPPPPPRKRPPLVRSTGDRMFAGVASGVARWLDVDVTIVRIVFVVAAFANGIGVIAYLAAALLLPRDTDPRAYEEGRGTVALADRGPAFWVGFALLGIAALVLVDEFPFLRGDVGPAVVLILLGLALWQITQRNGERRPEPTWPGADDRTPNATETWRSDVSSSTYDASGDWTPPPVPSGRAARRATRTDADRGYDWTPPPVPPREPSALGRVTVALAFLAAGVLVSLDLLEIVSVTGAGILATVLGIVGVGLLIGSFLGRARWLALVGLLLLPFVILSSLASSISLDLSDGFGERRAFVSQPSDLAARYELGAGQLTLDLRDIRTDGRDLQSVLELGAGEIVVTVPEDLDLRIVTKAQLGEISVDGETISGQGMERTWLLGARGESRGTLTLDLSVGAGAINVYRHVAGPDGFEPAIPEEFTR